MEPPPLPHLSLVVKKMDRDNDDIDKKKVDLDRISISLDYFVGEHYRPSSLLTASRWIVPPTSMKQRNKTLVPVPKAC